MQLFIDSKQLTKNLLQLTTEQHHYLFRVMRIQVSDTVSFVIDKQKRIHAKIVDIKDLGVTITILDQENYHMKTSLSITLVQACPKQDKLSDVINHVTQCGVTHIMPIITERTIVHYNEAQAKKKHIRWQKVAESAANQTGLLECPQIEPVCTFKQFLSNFDSNAYDLCLVAWEQSTVSLKRILNDKEGVKTCLIVIGPEGGLSENEVHLLQAAGIQSISLGDTIYRTELAAAIFAAQVGFFFTD